MNSTQKKEYRERFKKGLGITLSFGLYKFQLQLTRLHFRISLGLVAFTVYFYDFEARTILLLDK